MAKKAKRFGWGWVDKKTRRRTKKWVFLSPGNTRIAYVWSMSNRADATRLREHDERVVRLAIEEVRGGEEEG
jgi:hypothetical protein